LKNPVNPVHFEAFGMGINFPGNRLKAIFGKAHTHFRGDSEKVRLGSAWWLCDNPIGMRRQLEYIGSVDVLASFAGMVSDSRKLLSYGSRFEMFRRVLSDVLGEMAEMGQAPLELLTKLAVEMSYNEPKKFFNL